MPTLMVFGLIRPSIEPESTVLEANALFTRTLIENLLFEELQQQLNNFYYDDFQCNLLDLNEGREKAVYPIVDS